MHVTIEHSEMAIKAARDEAAKTGTQMCIAVVDSGANLKAFHRMDDAWVGSFDIAIKKAKTAFFFGMPTGQTGLRHFGCASILAVRATHAAWKNRPLTRCFRAAAPPSSPSPVGRCT